MNWLQEARNEISRAIGEVHNPSVTLGMALTIRQLEEGPLGISDSQRDALALCWRELSAPNGHLRLSKALLLVGRMAGTQS